MQKLNAVDASFLYTETEHMPNHIGTMQIFELPEDTDTEAFMVNLTRVYSSRMHLIPYLYRKIRFVPGNLDHPVWVTDPDFDISHHISLEKLPKPGTMAQLETRVAAIHAELLDRKHPLWQLVVFHGLKNPRQIALYISAHHACLDGMAGAAATEVMMDETPVPRDVEPPKVFPPVDDDSFSTLWRLSMENLLKSQVSLPLKMMRMAESIGHLAERAAGPGHKLGAFGQTAPRTRFNHAIEKPRSFAVCDFSLTDIRSMKSRAECSLNDVILAICAGGLRNYLRRHKELPTESLIAGVPVSLRTPGDQKLNNQVTMMEVSLATNVDDALERLYAIRDSELTGKEVVAEVVAGFDSNMAIPGLPLMMIQSAQAFDRLHLAEAMPTAMNVVISNVPGPRKTLYAAGARMLAHYPVSIPAHGMGVNITVQSYVDTFYLGITACAKALPDAGTLRDDIMEAFVELRDRLITD